MPQKSGSVHRRGSGAQCGNGRVRADLRVWKRFAGAARRGGARAGRRRAACAVVTAATAAQFVQQQRVESARRGVVRLVLQNQAAVLQRLRVMPFHDRRQELRKARRTGVIRGLARNATPVWICHRPRRGTRWERTACRWRRNIRGWRSGAPWGRARPPARPTSSRSRCPAPAGGNVRKRVDSAAGRVRDAAARAAPRPARRAGSPRTAAPPARRSLALATPALNMQPATHL